MAKKITCLVLAIIMLVFTVACSNTNDDNGQETTPSAIVDGTTVAGEETENTEDPAEQKDKWGRIIVSDDIPENVRFDGETVSIFSRSDPGRNRWRLDFYADEQNGNMINDAVYNRNITVAARLGINYKIREENGSYDVFSSYANIIQNAFLAGSHEFDVVGTYSLYGAQFATKGYFYDVNKMDNYINMDKVWWNQSIREDLTIADKLYLLIGDMNLTTLSRMMCVFFNKTVLESNLGVNDSVIYDTVKEGKWTIDYLTELVSNSYIDLNGNGSVDQEDMFGIVSITPSEAYDSMSSGLGVSILIRDGSGNWTINPDTEGLVDRASKCAKLYWANNNCTFMTSIENTLKMFTANHACFDIITLDKCYEDYITSMESDYGILPMPKYNEAQEKYYTIPQDAFNIISIMGDVQNPDMIAAYIELTNAESYKQTTPVYFDEALKYRYMCDEDSGMMLDYLRDGLRYDFATINTRSLSDAGYWMRNVMGSKENAGNIAASNLKAISKMVEKSLVKLVDTYEKLN